MEIQNEINLVSQSKNRFSNYRKLASAIIYAQTPNQVDRVSVKKTVQNSLGVFYKVEVRPERENDLRIAIDCEEEILEKSGLMQVSVFNVLKTISLKHGLCILNVENEFLPNYA